jgi:FkbM family methyltransferase
MKHPRMTQIFLNAIWNGRPNGFYVEIGAWDGRKKNSTIILENLGWDGVCIEPTPESFEALTKTRKCRCLNVAVFNKNGTAEFASFKNDPATNGLIETHPDSHKVKYNQPQTQFIKVETRDWSSLELPSHIDYLQLDTEGSELAILDCINWSKQNISYICLEDNAAEYGDKTYYNYMLNLGYHCILHQGVDFLWYKE